jgi:hypothetical protein
LNIGRGTLVELNFTEIQGNSDLTFQQDGCEVIDNQGTPIPLLYENGRIEKDFSESLMCLTHSTGNLEIGVFNNGSISLDRNYQDSPGILWKGINVADFGGLIFGSKGRGSVNGLMATFSGYDHRLATDFQNKESQFFTGFTSNQYFDQIAKAIFSDERAPEPYGVTIIQLSCTKTGEDFGLFRYGFVNTTQEIIEDFYAGIYIDWKADEALSRSDWGGYAPAQNLNYTYSRRLPTYFGITALDGLSGMKNTDIIPELDTPTGFRETAFDWISLFDHESVPSETDLRSWTGTAVGDLTPGDTAWATFAVVAGDDLLGIENCAVQASNKAFQVGWIEEAVPSLPDEIRLYPNFPNPFNTSTVIRFHLTQDAHVLLRLYDIRGRLVVDLVDQEMPAGTHRIEVSSHISRGLSSGIYLYQLKVGSVVKSQKMVCIK